MAEMLKNQGLLHPSTKFPWMILVLALWGPMAISINSYQAEGGADLKTYFIGAFLQWLMIVSLWFWWFFFIGLILALCCWGFGLFYGFQVMQVSK